MKKGNNKYKILIIVIILIYYIILPEGYYKFYRSLPVYPDSYKEIRLVEKYIRERDEKDIEFFRITNNHMDWVFKQVVNEPIENIKDLVVEHNFLILLLKNIINRIRPKQIVNNLNILDAEGTADIPAYPAGHALSAYYVAKKLKIKYPEKEEILDKIARECDITRIKAGLHYPSDGEFSKYIVDKFL